MSSLYIYLAKIFYFIKKSIKSFKEVLLEEEEFSDQAEQKDFVRFL